METSKGAPFRSGGCNFNFPTEAETVRARVPKIVGNRIRREKQIVPLGEASVGQDVAVSSILR